MCVGNASLEQEGGEVVKGGRVVLRCLVPDLGRPAATEYIWTRGGHELRSVSAYGPGVGMKSGQ